MRLVVAVCLAGMMCLAAVCPASAEITGTFNFDPSRVVVESREGFDVIRIEGCHWELDPGKPMIPVLTTHFSIPAGMKAVGVRIVSLEQTDLGTAFYLHPAQPPVRLDCETAADFVDPDPAVYESEDLYPGVVARIANNGNMGGYAVVGVEIFPLTYRPLHREVILNTEIEIALTLEFAGEPARVIRGRTESGERAIADRVRSLVVNPEAVAENIGPRAKAGRDGTVEYAIVTTTNLMDEFQPLADWKTKKGVPAQVFSEDWIYANYTGVDEPEQIRNFIKDYEANHGLVYVLIGGGAYKIPTRVAWDDLGYDHIHSELYYSDTDGSWNADGDEYWGEYPEDGVDMYGDVYVGRAPVPNYSTATVFVDKILTYEGAQAGEPLPTDYQKDMLFLAEVLWGPPQYPYTDGGIAKDMIDNAHVPSRFDPITKLYEDDGNLNHTSAMNALNAGQGITNHCGHANSSVLSVGPNQLNNGDMDALVNGARQGIFYSIGCWPASFETNCIANHYVNNANGGGVAFVGNDRYGWGCPGYPGGCVSDLYDQQFFRALFTSDLYRLGIAHADAKDYYVPSSTHDAYMRYALYELNVLGDPEMPVWTDTPEVLAVSHPSTLGLGLATFTVDVSTSRGSVEGACVCLMKGTEVYEVDFTDAGGQVILHPEPQTAGLMWVTVTKHNCLPYEGETVVQATAVAATEFKPAELVLRQNRPNPFNPVTEIEFGLPSLQNITLEVYNVQGQRIATLAKGAYPGGYHQVVWRGTDDGGVEVSTGVYFCRLVTDEKVMTRKMMMIK
ncbi:MAG: T9SS type A sorting domain-containing protein [Candidatus Eisenbacteria sp.]|nr:T9SS type A sorting domain-containing protein [Candidatus Eisenbacteria bacterium]